MSLVIVNADQFPLKIVESIKTAQNPLGQGFQNKNRVAILAKLNKEKITYA